MSAGRAPSLMLVCGEPSGDQLGAQLITALRTLTRGSVAFSGVGGTAMAAEGFCSLFPLDDTAVMGLREVVPKIPIILRRVRDVAAQALKVRPDAVVLIDSPDFTHRIARRLKRLDPSIPTINYVAPQVWASRAYRTRAMARDFDLVLALLPFEASFLESRGVRTEFVGHPVIERAPRARGGEAFREKFGIAAESPLLAVLPGSRTNEIRFILPLFRETVALLRNRFPDLVTILPTVPHVSSRVRAAVADWPAPLHVLENEDEKFASFDAANAALAASGTVTTELALARTPMVVAYRVGSITYALARPLFRLPYFTLVNLLLDRMAVPEFLQGAARPDVLAREVGTLLADRTAAARQISDLEEATRRLGQSGEAPSLRAAKAILTFVRERQSVTHSI